MKKSRKTKFWILMLRRESRPRKTSSDTKSNFREITWSGWKRYSKKMTKRLSEFAKFKKTK